jgi:hypothetical protein
MVSTTYCLECPVSFVCRTTIEFGFFNIFALNLGFDWMNRCVSFDNPDFSLDVFSLPMGGNCKPF